MSSKGGSDVEITNKLNTGCYRNNQHCLVTGNTCRNHAHALFTHHWSWAFFISDKEFNYERQSD